MPHQPGSRVTCQRVNEAHPGVGDDNRAPMGMVCVRDGMGARHPSQVLNVRGAGRTSIPGAQGVQQAKGLAEPTGQGPHCRAGPRNQFRGRFSSVPCFPTGAVTAVAALAHTRGGGGRPAWCCSLALTLTPTVRPNSPPCRRATLSQSVANHRLVRAALHLSNNEQMP